MYFHKKAGCQFAANCTELLDLLKEDKTLFTNLENVGQISQVEDVVELDSGWQECG